MTPLDVERTTAGDEHEAARRLADALEGGALGGVDVEALAAACLLAGLAPAGARDEVAAARQRRHLVAVARRRRLWKVGRIAVGVAAMLAVGALAAVWLGGRSGSVDLAAKEAEARAAVARAWRGDLDGGSVVALHVSLTDTRRERLFSELEASRFDRLRRLRTEATLETVGSAAGATPASVPTPGGVS